MRRKFKTENFKSHFTLPFFQSFSFGLYRALHISPFPPWGLWVKRKTNYFFRLSNNLLIIEERKCEINDEECMYLLFYLLLVCEHQITICFLFVCLFVCLFVYQATLHIIDLITLVIMNSFPLGLAHHWDPKGLRFDPSWKLRIFHDLRIENLHISSKRTAGLFLMVSVTGHE